MDPFLWNIIQSWPRGKYLLLVLHMMCSIVYFCVHHRGEVPETECDEKISSLFVRGPTQSTWRYLKCLQSSLTLGYCYGHLFLFLYIVYCVFCESDESCITYDARKRVSGLQWSSLGPPRTNMNALCHSYSDSRGVVIVGLYSAGSSLFLLTLLLTFFYRLENRLCER